MTPSKLVLATLVAAWIGGCSQEEGVVRALASAKIGMEDAIAAARTELGGGFALEAELSAGENGPVFTVELQDGDGVTEVVVDAVTGTVVGKQGVELSPEERDVLSAIDALDREARIGLPKALKRGAEAVGGGTPIEVDVELQDGKPVFLIVYSVEGVVRETVVPIEKGGAPNEPATDR